jgi:N-acetylmuramoyl-L-alanine amidase
VRKISYIVLHHTASKGINDGSQEWNQLQKKGQFLRGINYLCDYHYGIGPTGDQFEGQLESKPGFHCGNDQINEESLAVACIGNFELNKMSNQQKLGLIKTLQKLMLRFPYAKVMLHNEIVATLCPGINYPIKELNAGLRTYQENI